MPKFGEISGEEAIKRLEKLGFHRIRQRGSHVILKKQTPDGRDRMYRPTTQGTGSRYSTWHPQTGKTNYG